MDKVDDKKPAPLSADASEKLLESMRPSVFKIETDSTAAGTGWLVDEILGGAVARFACELIPNNLVVEVGNKPLLFGY